MGPESGTIPAGPVVVTGATGFIGTALVHRLLSDHVPVVVLTRDRHRADRHFQGRVGVVEDLGELLNEPRGRPPEAMVNLAGKNLGAERWSPRVKRALVASRVETTRHVLDYIRRAEHRPRVLVSGSAVGFYGARGDEPLDERAGPGDEYQSRLCREWEATARQAEEWGVRVCLSRTGVVLGPGGGVLSGLTPMFSRGLGAVVGSGDQWVSWIQMEDLLELFVDFLCDESLSGPFNNTAPEPVTHREFVQTLGAVLDRPVRLRVPGWAYRILAGGIAHLHLTGQRVVPTRHRNRGFSYRHPTLRPALDAALTTTGPG